MTKKTKQGSLTAGQRRYLRGLGHHLEVKATVGRGGLTEAVVASVEAVLTAHELVKVKVGQGCETDRHEVAEQLGGITGAAVLQVIGRVILLFRANPERPADKKIVLPAA